MSKFVCSGASLVCSFGTIPASLIIPPQKRVNTMKQPVATIMDHKPLTNIPAFGLCTSPSNPVVASATAANMGVLTPQPCIPVTSSPWQPGKITVNFGSASALTNQSHCLCQWGGKVTVTTPGQVQANTK